ncbi:MAG: hypothetical protein WCI36_02130 [bacterium]
MNTYIYKKYVIIFGFIIGSLLFIIDHHLEYFLYGFIIGAIISVVYVYTFIPKAESSVIVFDDEKMMPGSPMPSKIYILRGFFIGLLVSFILILIPVFMRSIRDFNQARKAHTDYVYVIQNCGNNPSDSCLRKLCSNNYDCGFAVIKDPLSSFALEYHDYRVENASYAWTLLIPDISEGLQVYYMFGYLGLLVLLLFLIIPVLLGSLFGFIYGKSKYK